MEATTSLLNKFSFKCAVWLEATDYINNKLKTTSSFDKLLHAQVIKDQDLITYISQCVSNSISVKLHRNCQKDIYNELRNIDVPHSSKYAKVRKVETRGEQTSAFEWKFKCFLCEENCIADKKHPGHNKQIVQVETLSIHQTLLDVCSNRDGDASQNVQRLLLSCYDLVAAEARYHQNCYTRFVRNDALSPKSVGRPIDSTKERNFDSLCNWFESECELYTLHELWKKLAEITSFDDVYDAKTIKFKLIERYGDNIYFGTVAGSPNVVTLRDTADYIVNETLFENRRVEAGDKAERIIATAARLVLGNIRAAEFEYSNYPTNDVIGNSNAGKEWLPPYLRLNYYFKH